MLGWFHAKCMFTFKGTPPAREVKTFDAQEDLDEMGLLSDHDRRCFHK